MDADGSRSSLLRSNTCLVPGGSEKQKTSFKDKVTASINTRSVISRGVCPRTNVDVQGVEPSRVKRGRGRVG